MTDYRSRIACLVACLSLLSFVSLAYIASPMHEGFPVTVQLRTEKMMAGTGQLTSHPFDSRAGGFDACEDSNSKPQCSTVKLYEDARQLGPPHSLHRDIESLGAGRFSHWSGHVLFSSSDGTSPLANGRTYRIAVPVKPSGVVVSVLAALLVMMFSLSIWAGRETITPALQRLSAPWRYRSSSPHVLPAYRPDIDGLRAVAVLGVVMNHYGLPFVPGGFTGVDLFFVISGYLITNILWSDITNGRYSILDFYARRFRRILPALLTVVLVSLLVGSVLLTPESYVIAARSAVAAALGVSNLFFLSNTGYFDQDAQLQPLLHTWSLGVEEQFYAVWPLILGVVGVYARHSRRVVAITLGAIILASFCGSAYYVYQDAKLAFYSPLTRAWELSVGALIVFLPKRILPARRTANLLSCAGVVLIAYGFLAMNHEVAFPGPNAAYTCLGAALLLLPRSEQTPVAQMLALPMIRLVGLWSYSLYLWHWPILVFARHYNNNQPFDAVGSFLLLALSLVLSAATWRYVENPFRQRKLGRFATLTGGAVGAISVILTAWMIIRLDGIESRLPSLSGNMASLQKMWEWKCPSQTEIQGELICTLGVPWAKTDRRAILYGDSHAEHLAPLVESTISGRHISVLLLRACPANQGGSIYRYRTDEPGYRQFCEKRRRQLFDIVANDNVGIVMFAAAWKDQGILHNALLNVPGRLESAMAQGLHEVMRPLAESRADVWLLEDTPWVAASVVPCSIGHQTWLWRRHCRLSGISSSEFMDAQSTVNRALRDVAGQWSNARVISLGERMCSTGAGCIVVLNDEPLYRDPTHFRRNLSQETNARLAQLLGLPAIFASVAPESQDRKKAEAQGLRRAD